MLSWCGGTLCFEDERECGGGGGLCFKDNFDIVDDLPGGGGGGREGGGGKLCFACSFNLTETVLPFRSLLCGGDGGLGFFF